MVRRLKRPNQNDHVKCELDENDEQGYLEHKTICSNCACAVSTSKHGLNTYRERLLYAIVGVAKVPDDAVIQYYRSTSDIRVAVRNHFKAIAVKKQKYLRRMYTSLLFVDYFPLM